MLSSSDSLSFSDLVRTPTRYLHDQTHGRDCSSVENVCAREEKRPDGARGEDAFWEDGAPPGELWDDGVGVRTPITLTEKRTVHRVRDVTSLSLRHLRQPGSFAKQPTTTMARIIRGYAHTVRGLPCNLHVLLPRR